MQENNDKIPQRYLKPGKCEFCGALLVVMFTSKGSALPVEVNDKNIKINDDEQFDCRKYKSHLLNCKKQQEAWEEKKKKFIKRRLMFDFPTQKELLK
jgi:hypothetical protein